MIFGTKSKKNNKTTPRNTIISYFNHQFPLQLQVMLTCTANLLTCSGLQSLVYELSFLLFSSYYFHHTILASSDVRRLYHIYFFIYLSLKLYNTMIIFRWNTSSSCCLGWTFICCRISSTARSIY